MESIRGDINSVSSQEILSQPISPEIIGLRSQQERLRGLKNVEIQDLAQRRNSFSGSCKELIKSAGVGVGTQTLVITFICLR
jgi:hypothetical protein